MDVCRLLEGDLHRSNVFIRWEREPVLSRYGSVEELVKAVRQIGDESDEVLRALLLIARADARAVATVIVGLLPLALSRCGRSQHSVDDLVGELAIVVGEAAQSCAPPSGRRVANVLLDRAWGRVRRPSRRLHEPAVVDPIEFGWRPVDPGPDPAELAVDRVALDAVRRSLASAGVARASTVRAWNTAIALAEVSERSATDRVRLKYARQVLRRSLAADLVA